MLLNFTLNNRQLILNNPEATASDNQISYIQCKINLRSDVFTANDTLVAVFKSASYQTEEEVLLDTAYGGPISFAFIPSRVFERGGVIQMLIYKYRNIAGRYTAQESTNTIEFFIPPNRYVPLRTSAMVQQLANEFQEVRTQVMDMTVDAYEADEPSVTKSIVEGAINLSFGLVRGQDGADGVDGVDGVDGIGIESITKTDTSGLIDTYTISYTDETSSTFTVTNGQDGEDGIFWATYGTSTNEEIEEAYQAGKLVCVDYDGRIYELATRGSETYHRFSTTMLSNIYWLTCDDGVWSASVYSFVRVTRTINGHALTNDITLTAADVGAQAPLVSGTNIRTLNGASLLGSGSIFLKSINNEAIIGSGNISVQPVLVSGTNIKTINNESILGSGNIIVESGGGTITDVEVDGTSVVTDGVAEIDLTGKSNVGHTHTTLDISDFPDIPSKVSDLTNDAGYITTSDVPTEIFWATYGTTQAAAIEAAWQAGKLVCVKYNGRTYVHTHRPTWTKQNFVATSGNKVYMLRCESPAIWTSSEEAFAPLDEYDKVDSYYLPDETDPVFTASAAYGITSSDISTWNSKSDFSGSYNDLTNKPTIPTVPTNVSAFTNDAGYLTSYTETDPVFIASAAYSITSSDISAWNGKSNFSGSYNDLTNKPTIPTITDTYSGTSSNGMSGKAVKSAIDALDGTITGTAGSGKTLTAFSQTDGKVSATFGNISITKSQISDFPTIPTVNNATLTIQKNGTTVNTFTANASSNVTANISVPTKVSDLTNDNGFLTLATLPVYNGGVS